MTKKPDLYINVSQAKKVLKINDRTVKRLVRLGKIEGFYKPNGKRTQWFISLNSVMKYLTKKGGESK